MLCLFQNQKVHHVVSANRNTYLHPLMHSTRIMKEHDFIYIVEGEWELGLGSEMIHAKKDDVIVLPANVLHYGIKPCLENTKTIYIHVSVEAGDGYIGSLPSNISPFLTPVETCISSQNNPNVRKYFEQVYLSKMENDENSASAWFMLLLCELSKQIRIKETKMGIAERIRSILISGLNDNVSNGQVAEMIGHSVRSVETIFKNAYGITMHQFTLKKKLEQGKMYLESFPGMSVTDISQILGFYDVYHFSKAFKQMYGVSPSEHRASADQRDYISCY